MQNRVQPIAAAFLSLILSLNSLAGAQVTAFSPSPLITPDHARSIYEHLIEHHWVEGTGLFVSFIDLNDRKLTQQGSTYEEAAVGLLAVHMGDLERAKPIFEFFRKAWEDGPVREGPRHDVYGLTNFYNVDTDREGIEKTIHVGPNAWAGLFAVSLAVATHDKEAFDWALKVANWIAHDVPHEKGGVSMGPLYGLDGTPWPKVFSTENNISYYAFLSALLRTPWLEAKDRAAFSLERKHIEDWLVNVAFDHETYTMNRGVNEHGLDRIHALDTVTWLISAVGPDRLAARGIDPDRLMGKAEKMFLVNVNGLWGVDSTDRGEAASTFTTDDPLSTDLPRPRNDDHRLIWYEGMGQYINALSELAAYAERKGAPERARLYTEKASKLAQQYDEAALKRYPKNSAYAYAMQGKFFHDGWWSPGNGPHGPPSSLIAATWRCMSGLGMDPLAGHDIPTVKTFKVLLPLHFSITKRAASAVVYGTSEDMLGRAWELLSHGDLPRTIEQAQATIQEWAPFAQRLQDRKAREVGHVLNYDGSDDMRKEIFSYWALNDVAAAYFILAKVYDQQHQYAQAAGAMRQIVQHYSLGQVWDPQGWFWTPADAVRDDFVSRDPEHYHDLVPAPADEPSSDGKLPD